MVGFVLACFAMSIGPYIRCTWHTHTRARITDSPIHAVEACTTCSHRSSLRRVHHNDVCVALIHALHRRLRLVIVVVAAGAVVVVVVVVVVVWCKKRLRSRSLARWLARWLVGWL